ncbi:AMP-binding protein [Halostagnicola sp. A56]|uniref:AMP-binding protein n=1 Tax=Halostagnicola sp. A56 TaxID=1495067 RepID=UPI00049F4C57|nr:AMP-binding protein [Halostagnicola sp. A56]
MPTSFEEFKDAYGIDLIDGIGTTEMLRIFISHCHDDDEIDPSATGFPVPGYEARIIDPDTSKELDRGASGLLAIRGLTGVEY